MSYKKQIEIFRAEKDQYFRSSHHSPLNHDLRHKFSSLDYFPIDENYKFILPLIAHSNRDIVEMETSDGLIQKFYKIGYLEFSIDGMLNSLQVYEVVEKEGQYFLPFRDKTSGNETYGAGRYINLEKIKNKFLLDFNVAYSPTCAYNENYSCPLPPFENHLKVEIKAGEKNFPLSFY